jgi:hypothetical protein
MHQNDMTLKAPQVDLPRSPFSRRKISATDAAPSYQHNQTTGSSLRTLFSRTKSFKAGRTSTPAGRLALSCESSNQLSPPGYKSARLPSLVLDDSRITTSPTIESCWSPRPRTSWDPPPLCQAYPQALRHALLDSPAATVELILRRQAVSTISDGSSTPTNLAEANISHTKTNKQKPTVDFALTRKLYILVTDGHMLQYAADGHHDRLPEKILPLLHTSVAFASDAIPGRPYVLQISRDPGQDNERVHMGTRNIWSRVRFRTAEEKRLAGSFLLVCESPDELDAWMISVRREIEAQGGAEYRCNTPRAEQDVSVTMYEPSKQSQQSQHSQDAQHSPRSLPAHADLENSDQPADKVITKYEPLPEIKILPELWSGQAFFLKRSSMDSSVNTSTELDDLRESSQCSSSTATGHRLSFDESYTPLSPAEEEFREIYTALTEGNEVPLICDQASPAQETINEVGDRSPLSPAQVPAGRTEQLRLSVFGPDGRPISIPNFSLPNLSQRYSRCSAMLSDASSPTMSELLDTEECRQGFEMDLAGEMGSKRPISTIAPLPSRETLGRRPRFRTLSGEHAVRRTSSMSSRFASSPDPLEQHNITSARSTPPIRPTAYSLFPKRHSSCDIMRSSPESYPPETDLSESSVGKSHRRSLSTPRSEEPANLLSLPIPRRIMHRPASMQIALGFSADIEKAKRSPAVTDLHFATNFGTANPFKRNSSRFGEPTQSCIPQVDKVTASMQEAGRQSLRLGTSGSAITGPPAGPPPTCPLPEPPSVLIRGSSVPVGLYSPRRIFLDLTVDD